MSIPCKVCQKFDSASKKCAKCKSEFYCSKNCQKTDWPFHKQFCNELAGYIEKSIKTNSDYEDEGNLLKGFDKRTVKNRFNVSSYVLSNTLFTRKETEGSLLFYFYRLRCYISDSHLNHLPYTKLVGNTP